MPLAGLAAVAANPALVLEGLERDGLAHRSGSLARLGGRAANGSPSTIES
jgi:hypothetical protein